MGPAALGPHGATIWFTGLPASGKSAIAVGLQRALIAAGFPAIWLDGDRLRAGLNADLGFGASDRAENVRRVAAVASMLADAGMVAVVSVISPYAESRRHARIMHEAAGLAFLEVFVDTALATCEERDPKGLYARARAGTLVGMTGVDAPYEVPERPELVLGDPALGVEACVSLALGLLVERGIISAEAGEAARGSCRGSGSVAGAAVAPRWWWVS